MGALLLLARGYWMQIGVGVVVLGLFGAADFYKSGRDISRADAAQLRIALKLEHTHLLGFQAELEDQSKEVQALKDAGDAQAKAFSVKIAQAAADVIVAKRSAVTIAARPQPKDKTACQAADDIFNEGTK